MIILDDFIMLGRTEPQKTKNNGITVCSAGYSETLRSLIRVYPIDIEVSIPKFSVCRVKLVRNSDARAESFKLADEKENMIVTGKLSKKEQENLKQALFKKKSPSIKDLNQRRASLGILVPKQISGHWKSKQVLQQEKFQLEMDIGAKDKPLFNMPDVPLLKIVNEDEGINNLQLRDWGCSEFIRRYVVTGRYSKDELWDALHFDKPQMLLVGNMRHFPNNWLVISTFTWTGVVQPKVLQSTLF